MSRHPDEDQGEADLRIIMNFCSSADLLACLHRRDANVALAEKLRGYAEDPLTKDDAKERLLSLAERLCRR